MPISINQTKTFEEKNFESSLESFEGSIRSRKSNQSSQGDYNQSGYEAKT